MSNITQPLSILLLFGQKSFKIRCMDYKRPLHADILRVYSQDYPVLQAIVGPRQVGKTTLAKQVMANLDILPGPGHDLTYWRSGKHEVDFVVSRPDAVWALEVKSKGSDSAGTGLAAFKTTYPEARALIIGGSGIPLEEFLSVPAREWFKEEGPS